MKLKLHKIYNYDVIEKLIEEHELKEKVNGFLETPSDDMNGEIGEIIMPLYFDDGDVACNFILNGQGFNISLWRCIYICQSLSNTEEYEV